MTANELAKKIVECIREHAEKQNVFLYGDLAGWVMSPSYICETIIECGAATPEELEEWTQ